jgi:hypothetical protein
MSIAKFYQKEKNTSFNLSDVFIKKSKNESHSHVIKQKKHYLIVVRDDFFD